MIKVALLLLSLGALFVVGFFCIKKYSRLRRYGFIFAKHTPWYIWLLIGALTVVWTYIAVGVAF